MIEKCLCDMEDVLVSCPTTYHCTGHWTRWYDNGQKREEFFITNGECAQAQHWDPDGVPI